VTYSTQHKQRLRERRHARVRRKLSGTPARPRLAVFRSNKHISAQVIDDLHGRTLAAATSLEATVRSAGATSNKVAAAAVGRLVAERAREAGIDTVVFDRGGFLYHGRIAAVADAARHAGLKF